MLCADVSLGKNSTRPWDGARPLLDEKQPVQPAAARRLDEVAGLVRLLVVHAQQLGVRRGLAQVVPGRVVLVQALVAAEEEERGDDGVAGGVLHVVVALSHAHGFLEQDVAEVEVGDRAFWTPRHDVWRQRHVRLDEHVGAEGGDHAVGLDVLVHAEDGLLNALVVQDGLGGVQILEEEVDAGVDQVQRHQARLALQGDVVRVVEVREAAGGQLRLALRLAQLGEHLGATALGALLLGDGIVGAVEAGRDAVLARLVAFANALDFAAVTAAVVRRVWAAAAAGHSPVAGALDRRTRGGGGHGGQVGESLCH